jgi:5'-3' exonuclease
MGIPSYFSYVLRNHFRIIQALKQVRCNLLLVDANSLIYDAVYENATNLKETVFQKILDLRKKVDAQSVFVAFDGVAPLAKMKQQKQRRYKSFLMRTLLQKKSWNTNAITPGTPFMNELDEYLKENMKKEKILYSGPNEVGEGEQKLFRYARENPCTQLFVYGLDADLIMLSLLHLRHSPKIYLYRETKHFSYMKGIKANEDYVFSVDEMAIQICQEMYSNTIEQTKAIDHYCFLCFLCGNDFLPHFPSIQIRNDGIPYLLNLFKLFKQDLLVEGTKIHWSGVKKLFMELAKQEQALIRTNIEWKQNQRLSSKNMEEEINAIPLKNIRETYLLKHPEEYYPFLFHQTDESAICKNYLRMLEWTLHYYHGDCKDYYMQYEFHLAPLFSSLVNDIPCFQEELITTNPCPPPSPITQLLYVLPYSDYKEFIPSQYKSLEKKYPMLCGMNFPLHYEFCKFLWESHVEFTYIPIQLLNKDVLTLDKDGLNDTPLEVDSSPRLLHD